jgi:hypothetical protein
MTQSDDAITCSDGLVRAFSVASVSLHYAGCFVLLFVLFIIEYSPFLIKPEPRLKCEDSIYRLSMSLSLALTAESLLKLLDVKLFVVLTLRPEFI